ncbi:MAG: DegT/DnrJ/EryC1/StrS family aminotransferase [Candidatus Marinimicrobia bacterium]|nr:DegT/DnrJ/EryC1/StrS family aminotransferase [Candidatus Neomarinimicrobiota bacterium]
MILTAGPSITQKEIDYVNDAVANGWNEHWNDYIVKFEKKFADYIGVKHALTTSCCTGALHLALVALGIKKGDEVIVPDISWIATASVVKYVNAEPVFADVLPDSWCINPISIEKRISNKTKAIIPVHLYGQPAYMPEILRIAKKYNLKVIEDAAPSIGAEIDGKRIGNWGDIAGFSFQGAKLLVTGEGGMLVTNNSELFERVKHFAEHGRASTGFEISDIGFKYKMSNIQAALGLAQLERANELINKKTIIYEWYIQRLENIDGLSLNNPNNENQKSIYWMTSIILDKDFGISRNELMKELKRRNIDTRPLFPQLSKFRMFKKYNNPIAKHLAENGINLPSGHERTEEEIDYICTNIKELLLVK